MYNAITNEFERLLREKQLLINKISLLKKGSVSKKNIKGKEQFYHQYRDNGKVVTKYISKSFVDAYIKETEERKRCEAALSDIELQLMKIKKASKVLSSEFYEKLAVIENKYFN